MYNLEFYRDKNNINEVEEYIKKLRNKNDKDSNIKYAKISGFFEALCKNGLKIGMPYIKHIQDELWELRPLRDRIFFGYFENNSFIVFSRFMKKTRKTPKIEIIKARKL